MLEKLFFKMLGWTLAALFAGFCLATFFTPVALLMRAFGVI